MTWLGQYRVFFDFDNTITLFDVLDDIIERFSIDKKWMKFEELWKKGKIGSKECLRAQLRSVRISKAKLSAYLAMVKVDPYFKQLLSLLQKQKIKPVILSDNFSFIIAAILRNNGITGIKFYSNELKFNKERLIPAFPHAHIRCSRCGHCKKNNLRRGDFRDKIIYIGDGLSDICPAENSDMVFAKESLLKHFRKKEKKCLPFRDLSDVYRYLRKKGKINGAKTKNL